jgi:hypothetical protein
VPAPGLRAAVGEQEREDTGIYRLVQSGGESGLPLWLCATAWPRRADDDGTPLRRAPGPGAGFCSERKTRSHGRWLHQSVKAACC